MEQLLTRDSFLFTTILKNCQHISIRWCSAFLVSFFCGGILSVHSLTLFLAQMNFRFSISQAKAVGTSDIPRFLQHQFKFYIFHFCCAGS